MTREINVDVFLILFVRGVLLGNASYRLPFNELSKLILILR